MLVIIWYKCGSKITRRREMGRLLSLLSVRGLVGKGVVLVAILALGTGLLGPAKEVYSDACCDRGCTRKTPAQNNGKLKRIYYTCAALGGQTCYVEVDEWIECELELLELCPGCNVTCLGCEPEGITRCCNDDVLKNEFKITSIVNDSCGTCFADQYGSFTRCQERGPCCGNNNYISCF